jgi:hypothetical protein
MSAAQAAASENGRMGRCADQDTGSPRMRAMRMRRVCGDWWPSSAMASCRWRERCSSRWKERLGVNHGIGANLQREVVAAEFALMADAGTDPPDSGMKEEEGFGQCLQEVPEEIGAANVGQLMGKYDFNSSGLRDVAAERGSNTRARRAPTVTGPAMALETRSRTGRRMSSAAAIRRKLARTAAGASTLAQRRRRRISHQPPRLRRPSTSTPSIHAPTMARSTGTGSDGSCGMREAGANVGAGAAEATEPKVACVT